MMEQLGVYTDEDFPHGKNLYCVDSPDLAGLPEKIDLPTEHFALLLATDATSFNNDDLLDVAKKLIDKGLTVVAAWGPDCERVHDMFDKARDSDETSEKAVLTTWHGDETLDETLWYFVGVAEASEGFVDSCTSWVAASVNHPGWAEHMRNRMEGSQKLLRATDHGSKVTPSRDIETIDAHEEAPPSR